MVGSVNQCSAMSFGFPIMSIKKHYYSNLQVALVPGEAFGDDKCIRISYAASLSTLQAAIERIKEAMVLLRPAVPV